TEFLSKSPIPAQASRRKYCRRYSTCLSPLNLREGARDWDWSFARKSSGLTAVPLRSKVLWGREPSSPTICRSTRGGHPRPRPTPRTTMSARILIADDDEVSCQLFAETLESDGFTVEQVTSGEAALARLDAETYDLLLIDVRMPGTSGLAVTRIAHEKFPALPIVVMTAFGSIDTAGADIHKRAFSFFFQARKPSRIQ